MAAVSGRPLRIQVCGQPFAVAWLDALVDPQGTPEVPTGLCDVRNQEFSVLNGQGAYACSTVFWMRPWIPNLTAMRFPTVPLR